MKLKKRLDELVHQQYPSYSKRQIQSWIMQGNVLVEGKKVTKPGTQYVPGVLVTLIIKEPKYVSRAGYKLEKALDHFAIDVTQKIALDAGISTGGFTDCLLQRGVQKVYGIDVGYGQVHEKIAHNPRVILLERTNLRHLETLGELVDIVTLDLSFISVLKVMDSINQVLKPAGELVVLIKPQFEAERHEIGKKGVIADPKVHERVLHKVIEGVTRHSYRLQGVIESPLVGAQGNKEFLAYFKRVPLEKTD